MIEEGFIGQKLVVVPDTLTSVALEDPAFGGTVVTDCGYYPHATDHGITRAIGIYSSVIILCTGGSGSVTTHGYTDTVHAGDAVILDPGVPHSYASSATEPWTVWWFHARGLERYRNSATPPEPVNPLANIAELTPLVKEMINRLEPVPSLPGTLAASGAARYLWALLMGQLRYGNQENPLVRSVRTYLSTHFAEPVNVRSVAQHVSLSPPHLMAVYKKLTGETLLGALTDVRMSHARSLLLSATDPVTAVAKESGFSDQYYFSRRFKQYHGVSPAEFRKNPPG